MQIIDNRPEWQKEGVRQGYRLLYAIPAYPTPEEEAEFNRVYSVVRGAAELKELPAFELIGHPFEGMKIAVREADLAFMKRNIAHILEPVTSGMAKSEDQTVHTNDPLWHEHIVAVYVTTQFPQGEKEIAERIKNLLGPWCSAATTLYINAPVPDPNRK